MQETEAGLPCDNKERKLEGGGYIHIYVVSI